jgi:Bacteriocin-protection, YdeI or OmpD-Associated/Domain of unknown function (DUF1905)
MSGRPVTTTATLTGEGGEYYFIVPVDFQAGFGRHRPPVRVTIRGHTFRTTPARYGTEYYVVVNRANRAAIGIDRGDRVRIRFELDTEPRVVEPPPELAASLAGSVKARAFYDELSFSHQKAYADWVAEAKRPETRVRRAAESVKRLLAGRKEPNG